MTSRTKADNSISPKPLFRYIDSEFAGRFSSTGELYLTSYRRCREHESAIRRDEHEGKYQFTFVGGTQRMMVNQIAGEQSYLLCTSISSDSRLRERFGVNAAIRIDRPEECSDAVSECIPNLVETQHGSCRYVWVREARKHLNDQQFLPNTTRLFDSIASGNTKELDRIWRETNAEHAERIESIISEIRYFAKPYRYACEAEYRMIWKTSTRAEDGLIVRCPTAVQYCSDSI